MNTLNVIVYTTLFGLYLAFAMMLVYYFYVNLQGKHQKEVLFEKRVKWRMDIGFSREGAIKAIKELDEKLNSKGEK